ncbi:phosphoribosylamine--glycine ligase [Paenisporosarcina sp. TG20]|uniref:phosphoribosylamine--glycine ligase n=1 Tax=Paenisporosarcina sp. TG20 TaxID=1211706 RepID=UPI0002D3D0B9|nr:phosphoribosylamine--glycine ligase [Paenisporosarcina sp. TG20]
MKVLVIGSGGREHAIVRQFKNSPSVTEVFVAPGNDGMKKDATCVAIDSLEFDILTAFVHENAIDLTFVGPEQPLAEGIVDYFEAQGLRIFGPTKAAAQIEGSKTFAKELMIKYNIPTAAYETFTDVNEAKDYIRKMGAPIVIKADGLASGKGVIVAMTLEEAIYSVEDMIGNQKFGESSSRVVIEEFLEGEEFSYMSFVHNGQIYPMVISQDHKRAYDGDRGPNTGGMGAYSPVPHLPESVIQQTYDSIVLPTVEAMATEGTPFSGILYAGVILTDDGPKVIEFNARFGDPETQVVLPRMTSDFGQFMTALLNGKPFELKWSNDAILGVVIASYGYPWQVKKGAILPDFSKFNKDIQVFHAGTKEVDGYFVGNGGRVILVTSKSSTLKQAEQQVYAALAEYNWEGFFYRTDIGWRAL